MWIKKNNTPIPAEVGGTWGNSFWSGADVEVSLANPRYVWAGGVMSNGADIFLSKDWGETFDAVPRFANMGTITGLYSHPTEDSTAYVLFGISGEAKIIEIIYKFIFLFFDL